MYWIGYPCAYYTTCVDLLISSTFQSNQCYFEISMGFAPMVKNVIIHTGRHSSVPLPSPLPQEPPGSIIASIKKEKSMVSNIYTILCFFRLCTLSLVEGDLTKFVEVVEMRNIIWSQSPILRVYAAIHACTLQNTIIALELTSKRQSLIIWERMPICSPASKRKFQLHKHKP